MKKDITAAITQFCRDNCQQVTCILLYGSYAKGTQRVDSDLDILVIDEGCVSAFRKQYRVNGYLIQATIYNFRDALNLLCDSPKTLRPFFSRSYDSALILLDQRGQGEYLKNIAAQILKQGPRKVTPKEYEYWRTGLVNYLNDGTFNKYTGQSKAEILLWGAKVIMMCRDVYFLSISQWAGDSARFKDEAIKDNNPELIGQLHEALLVLVETLDTKIFSQNIKSILQEYISFDENSQPFRL